MVPINHSNDFGGLFMMKNRVFKTTLSLLIIICAIALSIASVKKYFRIDPGKCDACGTCAEECPEAAISEGKVDGKDVFIIDPQKCTACGVCAEVCPQEAIHPDSSDLSIEIKEEKKEEGEGTKAKEASKEEPAKKKKKKATKYTVK